MKKAGPTINYSEAYEELRETLDALEQGEVDIDELSAKVKRAAELIEFCQKRLKETELEVKRVVDSFQKTAKRKDGDDGEESEEN
jgi:exodeoxyribonuclease VII small subunit